MTDSNAADRIEHALVLAILRGEYAPGDRIPPIRALAARWSVNAATAQRALTRLEGTGLVIARPGRGTVVQDPQRCGDLALLPAWFEARPDESDQRLAELLSLRRHVVAEASAGGGPSLAAAADDLAEFAVERMIPGAAPEALRDAKLAVLHRALDLAGATVGRAVLATYDRVLRRVAGVADAVFAEPDAVLHGLLRWCALLRAAAPAHDVHAAVLEIFGALDAASIDRYARRDRP